MQLGESTAGYLHDGKGSPLMSAKGTPHLQRPDVDASIAASGGGGRGGSALPVQAPVMRVRPAPLRALLSRSRPMRLTLCGSHSSLDEASRWKHAQQGLSSG